MNIRLFRIVRGFAVYRGFSIIVLLTGCLAFVVTAKAESLDDLAEEICENICHELNLDDDSLWNTYTEWSFKPGDNRVLGDGQLVVPIWQDCDSLIFADIRGQLDDLENYEGNWGLAYRKISDNGIIFGAYGFYDLRRTENDNSFDQATLGIEMMTTEWEVRANGYIPEDNPKLVNSLTTAELVGSTIFVQAGQERAYYGFDAEVGTLLYDWMCGDVELRGFVGGFHFDNDAAGFVNVSGPRARVELRGYDLDVLGAGSRLTVGAEYQWDQVRDDQVTGILQVRIPLGRTGRQLDRLERRMLDRIVRDVDVVKNLGQGSREIGVDVKSGDLLTNVTLVDANTADVPAAVVAAGNDSTVIVDGAAGTVTTTASIVVQDGQSLLGGGFEVAGVNSGAVTTFGIRSVIDNTNFSADTIVLDSNSTLRGLTIQGGSNGIEVGADYPAATTGVTIDDVSVLDTDSTGIFFLNTSNSSVSNVDITNPGQRLSVEAKGIAVLSESSNNTFSNITITNSTDDGIMVRGDADNNMFSNVDIIVGGQAAGAFGADGIYVAGGTDLSSNPAISSNNSFTDVTISFMAGDDGFDLRDVDSTTFNNVTIDFTNATGFVVEGSDATNSSGTGNTVTNFGANFKDDQGGNSGTISFNDGADVFP